MSTGDLNENVSYVHGSEIKIQPEEPNSCTSQKAEELSQANSYQILSLYNSHLF